MGIEVASKCLREMICMKNIRHFSERIDFIIIALLCVFAYGIRHASAASAWLSFPLKNNDAVIIENSPELTHGYCVVRGYFKVTRREFVAASEAKKNLSGRLSCKKSYFPSSYFFIQKEVELSRIADALSALKANVDNARMMGMGDTSAEVDAVISGGALRRAEYFSLNSRPWNLIFCSKGSFLDYDSCKSISFSLTAGGEINSIAVNDVLD